MQENRKDFENDGEIIIDTFPELPNTLRGVKDGVELTFGNDPDEELGFEFETIQAPTVEDAAPAPKINFELVQKEKKSEFSVPEAFEIKTEQTVSEPIYEPISKVRETYVPRFTEASERYRLGLYRPEADKTKKVTSGEIYDTSIDPTAEIDEAVESYQVTYPAEEHESKDNTAKVFRFSFKEESEPEKIEEPAFENTETYAENGESLEEDDAETESFENETDFDLGTEGQCEEEPEAFEDQEELEESEEPTANRAEYEQREKKYDEAPIEVGDKIEEHDRRDYTVFSQRETFIDKLLDSIMSIKIRFFTSFALFILILALENLFLFGVDLPSLIGLGAQRGAMSILDLIFVVCLYFLALPEVVYSFKALLNKKIVPELYLTVLLIVNAVYSVLASIYADGAYFLSGALFALFSTLAVLSSYFKKSAEHTAFTLVSQNGEKKVIDLKYTRELERENMALDGVIKEHVSRTARFFKTSFVSGFFKRSSRFSENSFSVGVTLAISLGIAILGAVIAYFAIGGIIAAAALFTLVLSLGLPAFALLSHKLPYLAITEELRKEKTAIIGESSIFEYAGADVVAFEDTEVFTAEDVNIQRIMLYGKNENLSKALAQMSALFQKVGGPLDVLFSNSLDRKCPPAYNTFVEEDGVSGDLDFKPVAAGTLDYMLRNGIEIPEEEGRDSQPSSMTTRVIYAAEDGKVYAKFLIRYSFSEEFSMLLPALREEQIVPLIYTRDPNITSEFIKTLTAGDDRIRVIKKRTAPGDDNVVYRRISSGGVLFGDKTNAIASLLLTRRYKEMTGRLKRAEILFSTVMALCGLTLSLFSLGALPTLVFALVEALGVLGLFLYTKKKIFVFPFALEGDK